MAYRKVSDDSLTAIADAIREKGGTAASLAFPEGFVSAIGAIEGGDDPFESASPFDYAVNAISGAAYGFALNDAGFYESQNRGVSSSYAICRVSFTVKRDCDITFDVIHYAEAYYDFGLFGNLDTALGLSASGDTTGVYKNFRNDNSADVVQLTYSGVTAGSHFIDVKYIKDASQDSNNDSLQFRVQQTGGLSQETIDKILAADSDLKAENIKAGVDIFGVVGTLESGGSDFDLKALIEKTISSLTLPDDLTRIGPYSLYRLEQIGSLVIPAGVTEVGAYAMYGCAALSTVTFMGTPTTLATSAFSSCSKLTAIYVPWAEGAVANAPWGATSATIHYNS